jgi:hypothetical protein
MARQKVDPLNARWRSMNRRCSAPTDSNYCRYGAIGISVAEEWNIENSVGFKNYARWVEEELNKIPLEHRKEKWRVVRRNVLKEFSSANCYITSRYLEVQRRPVAEWNFVVFDERRRQDVPVNNNCPANALLKKRKELLTA